MDSLWEKRELILRDFVKDLVKARQGVADPRKKEESKKLPTNYRIEL